MARSRKKAFKVVENDRQKAQTASPIRKRPAGPRRAVSQSQPQAQGLDQLAEAASVAEPANIPPPSGQSPASTASNSDDQELPSVRTIARHASARSRSRSPSSSPTDEPKEYYIEWLVYMGKELLHSDVVSSDKWDLAASFRGQRTRVKQTLELRGKGESIGRRMTGIPVTISAKSMKMLQFSAHEPDTEGWWNKIDNHVERLRREGKSDIRVTVLMRFDIEENAAAGQSSQTPVRSGKEGNQRETATQRQKRQEVLLEEIDVATGNNVTAIYKANQCKLKACKNFGRTCISLGNSGHVPLNSRALAKWNDAINKGTATVHEPPRDVIGDLLYEQNKGKAVGNVGGISAGGIAQPVFYVGCNGVGGPSTLESTAPPSSPIQPPKNKTSQQMLEAYLEWLGKQRPEQAFEFDLARDALVKECWGFEDLGDMTKEDWDRIDIPGGLKHAIKKHRKPWTKQQHEVESVASSVSE